MIVSVELCSILIVFIDMQPDDNILRNNSCFLLMESFKTDPFRLGCEDLLSPLLMESNAF